MRVVLAVVAAVLFASASALAFTPSVVKGDRIEQATVGIVPMGEDQRADARQLCGPSAPREIVIAQLYGPVGADPSGATVQTYRVDGHPYPFAVVFYAGENLDESPYALAIADVRGIVMDVYTGDLSGWPPLCELL